MTKLTCEQMQPLREAYLLETLSERQRGRAAVHLEHCPQCRNALEQARSRLGRLDAVIPVEPPAGLAERTLARIAEAETASTLRPFWRSQRLAYAGAAMMALCVVLLPLALTLNADRASSRLLADNLKRIGLACKMYANDSRGERYPPVAGYDGVWVPDLRALYPKYITDASILTGPGAPAHLKEGIESALRQTPPDFEQAMRLMAHSYAYHGWTAADNEDVEEIRRFQLARRLPDADIVTEYTRLYRLREGIERFLITDINNPAASAIAQSTLPVLIARPQPNHPDDHPFTCWWRRLRTWFFGTPPARYVPVLYMDGRVEFVPLEEAPSNIQAMLELFPENIP